MDEGTLEAHMSILLALAALAAQDGQFDPKWEGVVRETARDVADKAIKDMPPAPRGRLLIIPLVGDQGEKQSIVTDELGRAIFSTGKFSAIEKTAWDKIRELFGVRGVVEEVANLEKAVEVGIAADADYVLFGRTIIDTRYAKDRVDVTIHFRIANVKSKQGYFIGSYTSRVGGFFSTAHLKAKIRDMNVVWKVVIWVIVMLALPFVVMAFKEAAGGSRPLLPVMMVVGFTGIDIFLAFAMLGFEIGTVIEAALFVVSMAVSLFWNLFVLSKIAQMSEHGV
jgi:hypothetical protein